MAFVSKYSYKPGFSYKVSAQITGEFLDQLGKKTEITAKSFLDASRPEDSPTHDLFEWDDAIAAEKFRLHTSACVIRAIEVECVQEDQRVTDVDVSVVEESKQTFNRAYVNVNRNSVRASGNYVPTHIAMSNEAMRNTVLSNALDELKAFKRKYYMLSELAKVYEAIDEVEHEIHR